MQSPKSVSLMWPLASEEKYWREKNIVGSVLVLDEQLSNKKKEVATYQNVVWLDVPVDEAHLVNAVHSADQLGDVEPDGINFLMGKLFLATPKRRF